MGKTYCCRVFLWPNRIESSSAISNSMQYCLPLRKRLFIAWLSLSSWLTLLHCFWLLPIPAVRCLWPRAFSCIVSFLGGCLSSCLIIYSHGKKWWDGLGALIDRKREWQCVVRNGTSSFLKETQRDAAVFCLIAVSQHIQKSWSAFFPLPPLISSISLPFLSLGIILNSTPFPGTTHTMWSACCSHVHAAGLV